MTTHRATVDAAARAARVRSRLLQLSVGLWCLLEATLIWPAPDLSLAIGYFFAPKDWRKQSLCGLVGAGLGAWLTYWYGGAHPDTWLRFVTGMPFHSAKTVAIVAAALRSAPGLGIVKGAWLGQPFKLFFGLAPGLGVAFAPLLACGLVSRLLRFAFVYGLSALVKKALRGWSDAHPWLMSLIIVLLYALGVAVVDIVIAAH